MSANMNNSTDRRLGTVAHGNLASYHATSQGERQSIEEYFGPGGTFWSLPIPMTSTGEYIFDDDLIMAGKRSSTIGSAGGDTGASMGNEVQSSAPITNEVNNTSSSEANNNEPDKIRDEELFHAFLVSDISNDHSSESTPKVTTHHASPSHRSTRDPSPTSTRPSTAQQFDTSSPLSDYLDLEEDPHIFENTISSSPPATKPKPQKRTTRSSKPSPSNVQRRTTRSMKVESEEVEEPKQPKLISVVSEVEREIKGNSNCLTVRKRQQPNTKPKPDVSEVRDGRVSKGKSLAMRKRQQPQRAVKGSKK